MEKLPPRLRALAEMVPSGARVADIGTDHGYLPLALLAEGRISWAVGCDIGAGPLAAAAAHARAAGLEERLQLRQCDGLAAVAPGEADTVVIAGMGGETIAGILSRAPWIREAGCLLLLQPMSKQALLRRWLQANGWRITAERPVREGETFYTILAAVPGNMPPLSPGEAEAGVRQLLEGQPILEAYLDGICRRLDSALRGMARAARPPENAGELAAAYRELAEWKKEVIDYGNSRTDPGPAFGASSGVHEAGF